MLGRCFWKDQTFHLRSTQHSLCGKPLLIKAPPEDMKTGLLREQHIMFSSRILEEQGEGRLPARQGPPGTGAGPWLLLISYPKHTFRWKVTRVAARTTRQAGQCSLAWARLMQKHPSAKKTSISLPLTCTMFKAFSGRDAFKPHRNRKNQVEQKHPEVKSRLSLPLLHSYGLWPFEGRISRTAQHIQNSLQAPVWILCKLHVLLQSSTSPCPKCI